MHSWTQYPLRMSTWLFLTLLCVRTASFILSEYPNHHLHNVVCNDKAQAKMHTVSLVLNIVFLNRLQQGCNFHCGWEDASTWLLEFFHPLKILTFSKRCPLTTPNYGADVRREELIKIAFCYYHELTANNLINNCYWCGRTFYKLLTYWLLRKLQLKNYQHGSTGTCLSWFHP